jgi:hypothetical protein
MAQFIAVGDLFYSIEYDEDFSFPGTWRKLYSSFLDVSTSRTGFDEARA